MKLLHLRYAFSQNIVLQYNDLKGGKNLTEVIEVAFGPKGCSFFYCRPWYPLCRWYSWFCVNEKNNLAPILKDS